MQYYQNASFANNMSRLINKIDMRLGMAQYNLPAHLSKDRWAEVITQMTLVTFSRYFPFEMSYHVSPETPEKDGWKIVDEAKLDGAKFLGIKDVDWETFGTDALVQQQNEGYGFYDMLTCQYGLAAIGLYQVEADLSSLYNNGYFLETRNPNMFRLTTATGQVGRYITSYDIKVFVEHSPALTTISPTMMEVFEDLALADVADFLYQNLKLYDGLETIFAKPDLRLDELREKAQKREEIVQKLSESYVSAANRYQPYIYSIG